MTPYYEKNRERILAAAKKRYAEDPEYRAAKKLQRTKRDPEKHRLQSKKWAQSHRSKLRAYARNFYTELKREIFMLLGGKCAGCGWKDYRVLHIDHVNNDGATHRKSSSGINHYAEIKRSIQGNESRFQLLCANCNWLKRLQ